MNRIEANSRHVGTYKTRLSNPDFGNDVLRSRRYETYVTHDFGGARNDKMNFSSVGDLIGTPRRPSAQEDDEYLMNDEAAGDGAGDDERKPAPSKTTEDFAEEQRRFHERQLEQEQASAILAKQQAEQEQALYELMGKTRQQKERARKIRNQQNSDAFDHVCQIALNVGDRHQDDNPFAIFLRKERINSVQGLLRLSEEDMLSMGFQPTVMDKRRIQALSSWLNNPEPDQQGMHVFLRLMSLDTETFETYMDKLFPTKPMNTEGPTMVTATATTTVTNIPSAGLDSKAAKLQESRRKSQVHFNPDVTVRRTSSTG